MTGSPEVSSEKGICCGMCPFRFYEPGRAGVHKGASFLQAILHNPRSSNTPAKAMAAAASPKQSKASRHSSLTGILLQTRSGNSCRSVVLYCAANRLDTPCRF